MKKISKVRTTHQDIETIINSLEQFALGDIQYTKERPIAAFILSICFIEQLATLRYELNADDGKKPERFFEEYMQEYRGINLYRKARHTLVHNYSSRYQFDIDKDGYENDPFIEKDGVIYLNTNVFINYLKQAFEKIVKDFRNPNHEANRFALENSMYYPVLVHTSR